MSLDNVLLGKINFREYLEDVSYLEAEFLRSSEAFMQDVLDYAAHGSVMTGCVLPWEKTAPYIRLGEGKLSVIGGPSASGKSLLWGQVMTGMLLQARRVVIASFEMYPKETLYRMICQSFGGKAPRAYCEQWLRTFSNGLFIYDQMDKVDTQSVLGMIHYAVNELHATDVVIDSLTKCGIQRDNYAKQAEFLDQLQWCAKKLGVHIHLIAHVSKPSNDRGSLDKYAIRGAAEITDLSDNVFLVERNGRKEAQVEARDNGWDFDQDIIAQPDVWLHLVKNREWGHNKKFGLYFDMTSGNYLEAPGDRLSALDLGGIHIEY